MWESYFEWYLREYFPQHLGGESWNYKNDLCLLGADALYQATRRQIFSQAVLNANPFLLGEDTKLKNWKDGEYNLDKISFGKSLLVLYRHTNDETYLYAAQPLLNCLRHYPRTNSGGFWHKDIYPHQIWLDGLYMALPFYAWFEQDSPHIGNDILEQFAQVRQRMWIPDKRLYVHAWDESHSSEWADSQSGLSSCFWLRAEGWYLMALVDCYELLAQKTPRAKVLCQLLQEAVDGLLTYLDPTSGMFLQLIDRPDLQDNYPETSGSAMVAYSLLKGVRLGMIPVAYQAQGIGILSSIQHTYLRIEKDGIHLYGICASAGLGPGPDNRKDRDGSPRYYLSEAQKQDNQHGTGACMLLYGEYLYTI